jgi:8-oxo-dGTP pyrophosphatase MutT (NUDIX family)
VAEHSFVSRRDNTFREYPPASAQLAMIVPFYGDLTVWIRKPDAAGWHFPTSGRKSGETILEVAKRELWESARIVPPRLDLLGAMRYAGIGAAGHGVGAKNTTAYVYMCEVSHLSWWYDAPEKDKVTEVGIFRSLPDPIASESVEVVLEAALRARRTGLR